MAETDRWEARYRRERSARTEAERIAEAAIADLYEANQRLDRRVVERTAELAVALEQAEAAGQAKSTFLHGLAHELSTPLHAIGGLVELVRERSDDPEIGLASRQIEAATSRLHQALRTLVELASIADGPLEVHATEGRLGDYADRVSQRWRRAAARRGMLLVTDAGPDPDRVVCIDEARLDQIVDALVDNAVRHGAGRLNVEIEVAEGARPELGVRVTDEGPGIAEDLRSSLFDAFVRGDDAEGLGVGLTLARRVAVGLGGSVELVPSTHGTVVEVRLPASFTPAAAVTPPPAV